MSTWSSDVSLELRDMHILVTYTGTDIMDVPTMLLQAEVLAEEYGLKLVSRTHTEWISLGKTAGEFTRHLRAPAYPKADFSLLETEDETVEVHADAA